ncbi:STAS domain-containing protein [Bhargavaea ullalensis]|uniref:RsbT co-antagonist protein RsbR n=1 Tax=Bhargavaea ullalensis TaxID=1265685 RepID=A0ABV2GCD0_9BACL
MDEKHLKTTIARLNDQVSSLEKQIEEAHIPIIPSILPNTILIPFAGELSPDRLDRAVTKILNHAAQSRTDSAIVDFTALSLNMVDDLTVLGSFIENLTASLGLMGIRVIVVGISPQFARELVNSGLPIIQHLKAFATFKTALEHLMKIKGLALISVNDQNQR